MTQSAQIHELGNDFRFALRGLRRVLLWALAALVVAWLCSGITSIKANEVGLVRRFGRFVRVYPKPGAKFLLPWPIERIERISGADVVLSVKAGFAADRGDLHPAEDMSTPYCLTGDQNIIHISVVASYQISHPQRFLYGVLDATTLLRSVLHDAILVSAAEMSVDSVLTSGKELLRDRATSLANDLLGKDALDAGLVVTALQLETIDVPVETRKAFESVNNAKMGMETQWLEAKKYEREVLARKRNDATRILADAEQHRHSRIQRAKGDTVRFNAVLEKYRIDKSITRLRLYLETMDTIMTKVKKRVVPPGQHPRGGRPTVPPVIRMPE